MSATETVTIDRSEFEEIVVSLGALAGFADRIYGGNTLDSMLWNETLKIQKSLLEAADLAERGEKEDERRYERETLREKALVAKYVEAVAS